jgi:lysophospholipase L1-like esterase
MSKLKVRLSTLLLVIAITIMLIPAFPVMALTTPTVIDYVALGDSIATGTIINGTKITSYVSYFSSNLKTITGATVNVKNLAHDGDASNELLALLQDGLAPISTPITNRQISTDESLAIRTAVINAEVITISIGGNNLMRAANIPGFSTIDSGKATTGLKDFTDQWPKIIEKIKSYNSTARIIVNTVYNPYNTVAKTGYKNDPTLHKTVDNYLLPLNKVITDNQTTTTTGKQYGVADVHAKFHTYADKGTMGSITYFYPLFSFLRNPHPNSTGQNLITTLNVNAYKAY